MNTIKMIVIALVVLALAGSPAHASDPTGVYARIDKVVLEPNSDSPDSIQVWGVFSLAKPNDRNDYLPAARGYLFFKLPENKLAARREWNDLKDVAGSGQIVSFGNRNQEQPRLRKPGERPENPDSYTIHLGLTKVRGRTDYAPIRALLDYKD